MLHTIYEQSKEFLALTKSTLRGLHAELMRYYRHAGPITSAAMSNLLSFYNEALWQEQWTVAVATEFVFRFLAIHPFQDGNGQVGRGLFLLSLLQSPHEIISKTAPYLAIDRQIEKHKAQYYSVLNKCSNGIFQSDPSKYHIEYFLEFMVRILKDALDNVEYYRLRHQKITELSDAATRVFFLFIHGAHNFFTATGKL